MNKQIVVAKFCEQVSWLKRTDIPAIVYDRCPDGQRCPGVTYVELPNSRLGREAHTYLYHIIHNYHDLSNFTIFLQGEPFYHVPHLLQLIEMNFEETTAFSLFIYTRDNLLFLESQLLDKSPPFLTILSKRPNLPYWTGRLWREILGSADAPSQFIFASGAQFSVPRHRILQRPIEYYQHLLNKVENGVLTAWDLETFWLYIFGDTERHGYPDRLRRVPDKLWA